MTNTRETSPEEQRRQFQAEAQFTQPEKQAPEQADARHYAPIQTALRNEAGSYDWKRETGDIQTYQHREHHGWLHIDPQGAFYDRHAQPISRETALENANHLPSLSKNSEGNSQSIRSGNDQAIGL